MPAPDATDEEPQSQMRKMRRKTAKTVELDGRTLEGGGQLVRNALCLSALTGTPVLIHSIRGNRSGGGGLKAQHLACVKWLAHACHARVEGAELKSKTLVFAPSKADDATEWVSPSPAFKKTMRDGMPAYECRLDIGTAGSTGLALQAILPFILFSNLPSNIPIRLTLTGGTNVSGSPSYEYIAQVLLPTLRNIGFPHIEPTLEDRGWSQGGSSPGSFTIEIPPMEDIALPRFILMEGDTPNTPSHLRATFLAPQCCHDHFRKVLIPAITSNFGKSFSVENENLEIVCECSRHEKRMYFILVATISIPPSNVDEAKERPDQNYKLGRDWLYERKIRSHERAATEMAEAVSQALAAEMESGACVDSHMLDQLVIYRALARGESHVFPGVNHERDLMEPSLHCRTAEYVAKRMLGVTFDAEGTCEGVGMGVEDVSDEYNPGVDDLQRGLEELEIG